MPTQDTIDLSEAPSVLFLFGLAGVGKNFVGDLLGACSGRHVYHADSDITPAMREAIAARQPFTGEMRDEFFEVIKCQIAALQSKYGPLIVTQATYKQRHRDFITQHIPGVQFVHIVATDAIILERLRNRGDWISPEYASQMRANFEQPPASYPVLTNNGTSSEILSQVNKLSARYVKSLSGVF